MEGSVSKRERGGGYVAEKMDKVRESARDR